MENENDLIKKILDDIKNEIIKVIDNPELKLIGEISIDILGVILPPIGTLTDLVKEVSSKYNEYKLNCLLCGLAFRENVKNRLSRLSDYIKSNPERAICVANVFRKTINAECPKACIIYGLILAKHIEEENDFSQNELIICKALENATDYDLNIFKQIIENYLHLEEEEYRVVLKKGLDEENEIILTCEWCAYNRIFKKASVLTFNWDLYGVDDLPLEYYKAPPAEILMNYIEEASCVWNNEGKN